MPSINKWLGVTGDFGDPQNWSLGVAPDSTQQLDFDGTVSNAGVTFPDDPGESYQGLYIYGGYTGTLYFPCDITFNDYAQSSGATSNTAPGLTTAVTGDFSWTGGTINSGDYGDFHLDEFAVGIINPDNEGTVNLGSTLTLTGDATYPFGAALSVYPGTVNLTNLDKGDGFDAQKGSMILFVGGAPVPKSPTVNAEIFLQDGTQLGLDNQDILKIEQGATAQVQKTGNGAGTLRVNLKAKKPVVENHGTLEIANTSELYFDADPAVDGAGYDQTSVNNGMGEAVTKIEAGCKITCLQLAYVHIESGLFQLVEKQDASGPVAVQPDIVITGPSPALGDNTLVLEGAATLKRFDAQPAVPIVLKVYGSFLNRGQVELYAKRSDTTVSDLIDVRGGQAVLEAGCSFQVQWFPGDNGPTADVNSEWTMIQSDYTGSDGDAITVPPSNTSYFVQPDPNNGVLLDPVLRNNAHELRVKQRIA